LEEELQNGSKTDREKYLRITFSLGFNFANLSFLEFFAGI